MNKIEFAEQLRRSLSVIEDYTFVNDTIAYYENYIESQIRMGKSEEQVMQELGDPRLIAKSICASHEAEGNTQEQNSYSYSERKDTRTVVNLNGRQLMIPLWLVKILGGLAVIVILVLLFTVLKILSPFILLGVFGYMIYRLVTNLTR